MSLSEDKLKKAISLIESCKDDFELKDVHHDLEYQGYCLRYFDEVKVYLKGILYYMNK